MSVPLIFVGNLAGLSSLGVPGMPWHSQILADQLTLSEPGGAGYAHHITTGTPDFQTFLRPWVVLYYYCAYYEI